MAKSYFFLRKRINFNFSIKSFFEANKILIIILLACFLIGLLTGIFVAIKSGITLETISDFNLSIKHCENEFYLADFWTRFSSVLINMLILLVASLYVLLIPIGCVIIIYRSYLIGFNCTLIIALFGFSGAITSILVLFPLQIIISAFLILFFILNIKMSEQKKKYGIAKSGRFKISFLFIILFLVLIIIESILLYLFNATTILVL